MVFFIWGTRLGGRVDDMPGGMYVATKFAHVSWLPLIPLGSVLVLAREGDSYRGVPVPWSLKSIALAWIQAVVVVVGIALSLIIMMLDARAGMTKVVTIVLLGATVAAVAAWGLGRIPFIRRASRARALGLAKKAGMTEADVGRISAAYDRAEGG